MENNKHVGKIGRGEYQSSIMHHGILSHRKESGRSPGGREGGCKARPPRWIKSWLTVTLSHHWQPNQTFRHPWASAFQSQYSVYHCYYCHVLWVSSAQGRQLYSFGPLPPIHQSSPPCIIPLSLLILCLHRVQTHHSWHVILEMELRSESYTMKSWPQSLLLRYYYHLFRATNSHGPPPHLPSWFIHTPPLFLPNPL